LCRYTEGKDLERVVLAKALRYHLESRVLVHNNRTVVFD
jgi:formyltetrahydrofolate deformylase